LRCCHTQIAMRGLALLKVGGLLCYSTCSLNPLENEAVVAALLKRCAGAVEIVDCSRELPELHRAPGLTSWTVMDDALQEHESHAALQRSTALPAALKRRFVPSLWPPDPKEAKRKLHLDRCLRLLPHLANMGGFFVTLLRKTRPLPGPPPRPPATPAIAPGSSAAPAPAVPPPAAAPPPAAVSPLTGLNAPSHRQHSRGGRFTPMSEGARAELCMQLGLRADNLASLTHQLLCASERAAVVCRVAPELAPIFQTAALTTAPATTVNSGVPRPRKPLRIFAAGVTLARRSRRGKFKLTPEGAKVVAPHAKKRRVLSLGADDALELLERATCRSLKRTVPLDALPSAAAALPYGSCLLLLQPLDTTRPALPVPARRVHKPDGLRLVLLHTPGLEFRPLAIVLSLRAAILGRSAAPPEVPIPRREPRELVDES
jgi:hypothetical protein